MDVLEVWNWHIPHRSSEESVEDIDDLMIDLEKEPVYDGVFEMWPTTLPVEQAHHAAPQRLGSISETRRHDPLLVPQHEDEEKQREMRKRRAEQMGEGLALLLKLAMERKTNYDPQMSAIRDIPTKALDSGTGDVRADLRTSLDNGKSSASRPKPASAPRSAREAVAVSFLRSWSFCVLIAAVFSVALLVLWRRFGHLLRSGRKRRYSRLSASYGSPVSYAAANHRRPASAPGQYI
ncbi:MAG: hypothetical protein MHM6MM_003836 [Cercozoa sp. M6MM]